MRAPPRSVRDPISSDAAGGLGRTPGDVQAEPGGPGAAAAALQRRRRVGDPGPSSLDHEQPRRRRSPARQADVETGAVGRVGEHVADQRVEGRLEVGPRRAHRTAARAARSTVDCPPLVLGERPPELDPLARRPRARRTGARRPRAPAVGPRGSARRPAGSSSSTSATSRSRSGPAGSASTSSRSAVTGVRSRWDRSATYSRSASSSSPIRVASRFSAQPDLADLVGPSGSTRAVQVAAGRAVRRSAPRSVERARSSTGPAGRRPPAQQDEQHERQQHAGSPRRRHHSAVEHGLLDVDADDRAVPSSPHDRLAGSPGRRRSVTALPSAASRVDRRASCGTAGPTGPSDSGPARSRRSARPSTVGRDRRLRRPAGNRPTTDWTGRRAAWSTALGDAAGR